MEIKETPLSIADSDRLVKWLNDPAFDVLARLLASESFRLQCEAMQRFLYATTGGDAEAKEKIRLSIFNREVLLRMKYIRDQKTHVTFTAAPDDIKL